MNIHRHMLALWVLLLNGCFADSYSLCKETILDTRQYGTTESHSQCANYIAWGGNAPEIIKPYVKHLLKWNNVELASDTVMLVHKGVRDHSFCEPLLDKFAIAARVDESGGNYWNAIAIREKEIWLREQTSHMEQTKKYEAMLHISELLYLASRFSDAAHKYIDIIEHIDTHSADKSGSIAVMLARSLLGLGAAYEAQGLFDAADQAYRSVADVLQSTDGGTSQLAGSLHNRARIAYLKNNFAAASLLAARAEAIKLRSSTRESRSLRMTWQLQALIDGAFGRFEQANQKVNLALSWLGKVTSAARSELSRKQSEYALEKNRIISSKPSSPDSAYNLEVYSYNLHSSLRAVSVLPPTLLLARNEFEKHSLLETRLILNVAEKNVEKILGTASELLAEEERWLAASPSDAQAFAIDDLLNGTLRIIYGAATAIPDAPRLRAMAWQMAYLHKGRAADAAERSAHRRQRTTYDETYRARLTAIAEMKREVATLMYGSAQERSRAGGLLEQITQNEAALGDAGGEGAKFSARTAQEIVDESARRLPARSVLIDIEVAASLGQTVASGGASPPSHYVALLLFPDGRTAAVDLGSTDSVNAAVENFLVTMQSPMRAPEESARELYELVFRPIRPLLLDTERVHLALEGALSLVTFAALYDGRQYLVDKYRFSYLTSARDLSRPRAPRTGHPALLVGAPDVRIGWQLGPISAPSEETATAGHELSRRLASLSPLPGAQGEIEALAQRLRVTPFVGSAAREDVLRTNRAPWLLHIASHAVWLDGLYNAQAALPPSRSALRPLRPSSSPEPTQTTVVSSLTDGLEAMGRTALVLAGAAGGVLGTRTDQDGLLTGFEARGLNLQGTQLVVLSACETGRGAMSVGHGVFGLRRGFLAAGAETVLASQWRVDDQANPEMMTTFYDQLLHPVTPLSRLSALQRAMLETKQKHPHPHYWAPFILLGEDGPIALPPERRR